MTWESKKGAAELLSVIWHPWAAFSYAALLLLERWSPFDYFVLSTYITTNRFCGIGWSRWSMALNSNHRTRAWTEAKLDSWTYSGNELAWVKNYIMIYICYRAPFVQVNQIYWRHIWDMSVAHISLRILIISLGRRLTYHVTQEFSLKSNCALSLNLESWPEGVNI
jgi:hypothetical protein